MAGTDIISATLTHARFLATDMREADVREVEAMGFTPYGALVRSITLSGGECWTILMDGDVAAIGGVASFGLLQRAGVPWVLTGKIVDRKRKTFFKVTTQAVEVIRKRYAYLTNVVDSRYTTAIRWLERLGFEVEAANAVMIGDVPFYRLTMRGE